MKEECLICGAPLEYLETDVQMQCEICRKKGARQDALRKRALRVQRLPYAGA